VEVSVSDLCEICHLDALIGFVLGVLPDHNASDFPFLILVSLWRQVVDAAPFARRKTQNQRMQATPCNAADEIRESIHGVPDPYRS
jgi:hypothetical protein